MSSGTEIAADESRVVESHERRYAIWNRDLAAGFAIQFHLDQPVRSRDVAFEMSQLAEMRRNLGARVSWSGRPDA